MNGNSSPDHEVKAARDQPERFLGPLLQTHRSSLRRIARRRMRTRLRGRLDTSDIVQQTLVEAWQSWPGFLGSSRGQFFSWLKTVLYRVVFRASRRTEHKREHWPNQGSIGETSGWQIVDNRSRDPAEEAALVEQIQLLGVALGQLSEAQRTIIILRHFQGLPFKDIATLTARSAAAARMVYIRGIIRLRDVLDEIDGGNGSG